MNRFLHFIQYHNAIPLAVTIVVMGAGATFAATDPQAIYSANQQTVAIDNTYLVNKDLSTYTPTIQIVGVTEDSTNYYVAYNLSTIDLDTDSVWKDVVKNETMTVSKADLGQYRDLGVYVTQQLKQIVDNELARLKATQVIEKQNVSQKEVATTYGGLVGKFLNDTTETLPGYTPVVSGPPGPAEDEASTGDTGSDSSSGNTTSSSVAAASSGNPSLIIQLLGNNPAQIPLRSTYVDLGAVVTDAQNDNIGIHTFLNGVEVRQITIDTSTTSVSTVTYKAADPAGNTVSVDRTVYVYDPAIGPPVPASEVQNAANTPPASLVPVVNPAPDTMSTSTDATSTDSTSSTTASSTPDTSATTTATTTPPADTATSTASDDTAPAPDSSASSTDSTSSPQAPDDTSGATSTSQ